MVQKITSPFGGYYIYPDDPNNLFQQFLGGKSAAPQDTTSELTPATDVYEDDKSYYASMVMPGVNKENLTIKFSDGTLTVNASVDRTDHKDGHWVQQERRIGTYVRSIRFRSQVIADEINAQYNDGILEVTIPKKSDKQKSVSINVS